MASSVKNVVINVKANTKGVKQLQTEFQKLEKENKDLATQFKKTNKQLEKGMKKSQGDVGGMSSAMRNLGGVVAGAFAVHNIVQFGKAILDTRAEFQKLEAVLTNTLGSKSEAQESMKNLQKFASETPFSVIELTQSFVKLVNQGFKPTMKEMTKLGDLASSTGKDFDMLAEAIIDAQTGEFERLKEFGIRASKQGDQVKFTFKGVETQTKFTTGAIKDYILSLGDLQGVSGSMVAISKTLGGQMSNLGDAWDSLLNSLGKKSEGVFADVIGSMASLVKAFTETPTAIDDVILKLEEEKTSMQGLITGMDDVNFKSEDRIKIIKQLKKEYPDLVGFLNTEASSNDDLATALGIVNESLQTRTIIQNELLLLESKETDLTAGKNTIKRLENEILAEGVKLMSERGKLDEFSGFGVIQRTTQDKIDLINEEVDSFSVLGLKIQSYEKFLVLTASSEELYNKAKIESNQNITDIVSSLGNLNVLTTDELKNLVTNNTLTDKKLDNDARLIIIQREQALALIELSKIKKKVDEDAIDNIVNLQKKIKALTITRNEAKDGSIEFTDAVRDLKIAQADLKRRLDPTNDALERQKDIFKELNFIRSGENPFELFELEDGDIDEDDMNSWINHGMGKADWEIAQKNSLDEQRQHEKNRQDIRSASFDAIESLSKSAFDIYRNRLDAEFEYDQKILDSKLQAKLISQSEYEVAEKKLFQERAERQEKLAIFEINVAGAMASAQVWATHGAYPVVAGVLQAIVVAETLAQIGIVKSQSKPEYEDGGWIGGKRHKGGGTDINAEVDEFVVNRTDALKNPKLLENVNAGNGMDYINRTYVYPALQRQSLDNLRSNSLADNIANSIAMHQSLDDQRIVGMLGRIDKNGKKNTSTLVKALGNNRKDLRNV